MPQNEEVGDINHRGPVTLTVAEDRATGLHTTSLCWWKKWKEIGMGRRNEFL